MDADRAGLEALAARLTTADDARGCGVRAHVEDTGGGVLNVIVPTGHARPDIGVCLVDDPARDGFAVFWDSYEDGSPVVAECGSEDVAVALVGLMLRDGLGLPAEVRP